MLHMRVVLACLLIIASGPSIAGGLPDRLTIGYDDEGDVDASPKACEATVKELVEWEEAQMREATATVCAARKSHVDAYAALQKSYSHFAKVFGEDVRLNTAEAVQHFQQMIKACIDHKNGLTTGGHNIALDIIPNQIAANCLDWGRRLLEDETAWYEQPSEQHQRASP